jgi:DNA-binding LacI/PurR family transcriptional regulator
MQNLLSLGEIERPTALMAFNDVIALGALHAIRMYGLSVPKDISIIGCDDIFVSAHANPPLTTISQPKYRIGALAIQTLRQMKQDQVTLGENCTVLESPLIVRESTGPAPQTS